MPEGDSLYRIANRLRPILVGQAIVTARAWRPRSGPEIDAESLVGCVVDRVEAKGKHLIITFGDGRVVHTHLGMTGSWHAYPVGAAWRKPERSAGLVLATTTHVAVCFSPKLLELTTSGAVRRDRHLRRLGPDLMKPDIDLAAIVPRIRTHNAAAIGEAVMNQTIAAGIGNVYKSESLFLAKINPWRQVAEIDDDTLLAYFQRTHDLMRSNRGRSGMRTTRHAAGGPRVWVYGRRGDACLVCGAVIQMRRQGDQGRSTYWCPKCQPATAGEPQGDERAARRKPPIKGCG